MVAFSMLFILGGAALVGCVILAVILMCRR